MERASLTPSMGDDASLYDAHFVVFLITKVDFLNLYTCYHKTQLLYSRKEVYKLI